MHVCVLTVVVLANSSVDPIALLDNLISCLPFLHHNFLHWFSPLFHQPTMFLSLIHTQAPKNKARKAAQAVKDGKSPWVMTEEQKCKRGRQREKERGNGEGRLEGNVRRKVQKLALGHPLTNWTALYYCRTPLEKRRKTKENSGGKKAVDLLQCCAYVLNAFLQITLGHMGVW